MALGRRSSTPIFLLRDLARLLTLEKALAEGAPRTPDADRRHGTLAVSQLHLVREAPAQGAALRALYVKQVAADVWCSIRDAFIRCGCDDLRCRSLASMVPGW